VSDSRVLRITCQSTSLESRHECQSMLEHDCPHSLPFVIIMFYVLCPRERGRPLLIVWTVDR
jgi:hypothetical protein